jgi:tetratricopeptide (TPR) repeat protein
MPRRFLFGPVTAMFADQCLHRHRQAGCCLTFGSELGVDLLVSPSDTWQTICRKLPADGQPDFVLLHPSHPSIPDCVWSAPIPVIALAGDWSWHWHQYRQQLRSCDLVFTDSAGVERLGREGLGHVRSANLSGCRRYLLETSWPEQERDIDVLFVGDIDALVHPGRQPWLARLARLGSRFRVVIRSGISHGEYQDLLGRSRIVFNHSDLGVCNPRVFEAVIAGALLFQEAGNREVPRYFAHGKECVYYTDRDFEELVGHFLAHEDERRTIAEAAKVKVPNCGYGHFLDEILNQIDAEYDELRQRASKRNVSFARHLVIRCWQAVNDEGRADASLTADIQRALQNYPDSAILHNTLGVLVKPPRPDLAVKYFQQAVECDPSHVVAGLSLVEALRMTGQEREMLQQAHRVLHRLNDPAPMESIPLDSPRFPMVADPFSIEWERAAWLNAGDAAAETEAKRRLLRWRLHCLVAHATRDINHVFEAVLARPDIPVSRAVLGRILLNAGKTEESLPHLRSAAEHWPFDMDVVRLLATALERTGDSEAGARLIEERRHLCRVAGIETNDTPADKTEAGEAKAALPESWESLKTIVIEYVKTQEWPDLRPSMDGALEKATPEDLGKARRFLEQLVSWFPWATMPRRLLAHLLIQHVRDLAAAEKIARMTLEVNAEDTVAREQLAVIHERQGAVANIIQEI